jgi:uncharacterized protein YidB (DUF937 family)
MGLLDGLLGGVLGGAGSAMSGMNAQSANPMLQMALQLIQQHGGIGGVLQQFEQAGHGGAVQSWLSASAQNQPISGDVLQQVLGQGSLAEIAQKFGMSPQQAASGVAQALPGVIDQMTPNGTVPADHSDQVSQALAQLQAMKAKLT